MDPNEYLYNVYPRAFTTLCQLKLLLPLTKWWRARGAAERRRAERRKERGFYFWCKAAPPSRRLPFGPRVGARKHQLFGTFDRCVFFCESEINVMATSFCFMAFVCVSYLERRGRNITIMYYYALHTAGGTNI